jgi:hypothetical protein
MAAPVMAGQREPGSRGHGGAQSRPHDKAAATSDIVTTDAFPTIAQQKCAAGGQDDLPAMAEGMAELALRAPRP